MKRLEIRQLVAVGRATYVGVSKDVQNAIGVMVGDQVIITVDPPYMKLRKIKPEEIARMNQDEEKA